MLYQGSKIVLGKGTHDLGDTTLILDREVSIVGEAGVPREVRRRPTALAFAIPRLIISYLPGHPHPCLFFPPSLFLLLPPPPLHLPSGRPSKRPRANRPFISSP